MGFSYIVRTGASWVGKYMSIRHIGGPIVFLMVALMYPGLTAGQTGEAVAVRVCALYEASAVATAKTET